MVVILTSPWLSFEDCLFEYFFSKPASIRWFTKESEILDVISWYFFSIHQQYTLFWISTAHKNYRDNQIGRWNRCCLWPRKYTKKLLVTNWEPPGLYTHLNQCVKLLRQLDANYHRKCGMRLLVMYTKVRDNVLWVSAAWRQSLQKK